MKINIYITITFFLLCCKCYAQERNSFDWSPEYSFEIDKHQVKTIIKDDLKNEYYIVYQKLKTTTYKFSLREFILNKFSKSQELIFSKNITLPQISKQNVKLIGVEIIEGQLIVLGYYKKPLTREGVVIAFNINKNGELSSEFKELLTYKLTNNDLNDLSPFIYKWSEDKSKLVFYRSNSELQNFRKNSKPPSVNAFVLNSKLENIWSRDVKIEGFIGRFEFQKCLITNSGTVHFLYGSRVIPTFDRLNYSLFSTDSKGESKIIDIDLKEKREIHEIDFISDSNKLIFSGICSNKNIKSPIKIHTLFYFQIDENTHKLDYQSLNEVSNEVINKIFDKKDVNKDVDGFNILNFFKNTNNEYYVIGEVQRNDPRSSTSSSQGVSTYLSGTSSYIENYKYSSIRKRYSKLKKKGFFYSPVFHDVIIFKLSKDGTLLWENTFEKNRSIYGLFKNIEDEKFTFYFNENAENNGQPMKKSDNGTFKESSKVVKIELNKEGDLTKEYLMSTYNSGLYLETEYFIQNKDEFYILSSGKFKKDLKQRWLRLKTN